MSADKQNMSLYAGDDCILSISITDETGAALSLAGATLTWKLAQAAGSAASITKTSGGSGITITDSASGSVAVAVLHSDTVGFRGPMWHQLVLADSGGLISTVTTGTITFKTRT